MTKLITRSFLYISCIRMISLHHYKEYTVYSQFILYFDACKNNFVMHEKINSTGPRAGPPS